MIDQKIAVCTVSDNNFALVTYTMLYSFLKNNSWFDGDIYVFTEGITDNNQIPLKHLYPNVKIVIPDLTKYEKALANFKSFDNMGIYDPETHEYFLGFARYWPHALKFEAFGLEGYDRVVFLDSDILVLGSLKELFEIDADFGFAKDTAAEKDFSLDAPICKWDGETNLNSGVFSIRAPKQEYLSQLIEMGEHYMFKRWRGQCCEQDIINEFLVGKNVVNIGVKYNAVQDFFADSTKRKITTEKVVHYFTIVKPWLGFYEDFDYIHEFWRNTAIEAGVGIRISPVD